MSDPALVVVNVKATDTVRLVDTSFDANILEPLAGTTDEIGDLEQLARITQPRVLAESDRAPNVARHALVRDVPGWRAINAAFSNPPGRHHGGGRFNSAQQGAWYAGAEIRTAIAETHFHRERRMRSETPDLPDTEFAYRAWIAEFHTPMAVLHRERHRELLDPDHATYPRAQAFAQRVREREVGGIVYPSVRRPEGMCLVSFRASLVQNVRAGDEVRMEWERAAQVLHAPLASLLRV